VFGYDVGDTRRGHRGLLPGFKSRGLKKGNPVGVHTSPDMMAVDSSQEKKDGGGGCVKSRGGRRCLQSKGGKGGGQL